MSDLDVRIRDSLDDLVRLDEPSPLLRDRTLSRIRRKQQVKRFRRTAPAVLVAAVLALILAVLIPSPDDSDVDVTTETTEMTDSTNSTLRTLPDSGDDSTDPRPEDGGPDVLDGLPGAPDLPQAGEPTPDGPGPGPETGADQPQQTTLPTTTTTIFCDGPCEGSLDGTVDVPTGAIPIGETRPLTFTMRNVGPNPLLGAVIQIQYRAGLLAVTPPAGCSWSMSDDSIWSIWSCPLGDLATGAVVARTFHVGPNTSQSAPWFGTFSATNAASIERSGVVTPE